MHVMGRPTKLTEEVQGAICRALEKAVPVETACEIAGITHTTYKNWRARGRRELERVEEGHHNCRVRKEEKPYVEFLAASTRARANCERQLTKYWYDAAEEDWRASMELLQRKYPDRWSKKEKHEHSGPEGGPMQHRWGPPRDTDEEEA